MIDFRDKLIGFIDFGTQAISGFSEADLMYKSSTETWSKKEILGHLIDSGVVNLQRFTNIQFKPKPFIIRSYAQNDLVEFNDYQRSDIKELLNLWKAINQRIIHLISLQTEQTLNFEVILVNGNRADLKFLIEDYAKHLEHHLDQILS